MNDLIEIVKIGGPVTAVSVVFLYYIDRMDKRNTTLIQNHFQHVSDAIDRNTKVLSALVTLIKKLNGKTRQR